MRAYVCAVYTGFSAKDKIWQGTILQDENQTKYGQIVCKDCTNLAITLPMATKVIITTILNIIDKP